MSRVNNFTDIPHTYSTNLPVGPGTINSLGVKTCKQIININTAYRDNYTTTSATNYIVKLPQPIRNVISMKLFDYHLPQDNYSISNYYINNNFNIIRDVGGISTEFPILIPDGMYTFSNINDLKNEIQDSINSASYTDISDIKVDIDELTLRTTIYSNTSIPFKLDFSFETSRRNIINIGNQCASVKIPNIVINNQLTLGWLLGFRGDYINPISAVKNNKAQYPSTRTSNHYFSCMNVHNENLGDINFSYMKPGVSSYTSEGLLNIDGQRFMLLDVNDFQNNNNTVYMSPFKDQSLLTCNIIAKLTDDKQYSLSWPPRVYFGPTNIEKLAITIYDSFGRIYNNNYGDYSIELLVEWIYDGK